jgi:L-asparagine transporter-like permease
LILISHMRFRRVHKAADLPVRMPLFPVMQIMGLVLLTALLITMGLDKDWNVSWIVGVPWLALLTAAYFIWKKTASSGAPVTAPAKTEHP